MSEKSLLLIFKAYVVKKKKWTTGNEKLQLDLTIWFKTYCNNDQYKISSMICDMVS